jgi:hypothetical protein
MSLRRRILGSRPHGWTDQARLRTVHIAINVRRVPLAPTPTIAPIMGRRLIRPNDDGLSQFLVLIGFGLFAAVTLRVAFG